jgi:uncharacterized membrane protein
MNYKQRRADANEMGLYMNRVVRFSSWDIVLQIAWFCRREVVKNE